MTASSGLKQRLARIGALRFAYRCWVVLWRDRAHSRRRPRDAVRYVFTSREVANFTYELANEEEIKDFVGSALGVEPDVVAAYLEELRADRELMDYLGRRLEASPNRDPDPRLGKRRALYCVVRAQRPGVIVESGVHDGIGTTVLLRALERNEAEGDRGVLLTFDINPAAGWLIDRERHHDRHHHWVGDTRKTLEPALEQHGVDLFIHDSLRTHEHESFELEAALRHRRGERLVLNTDDTDLTGALPEVCARHGGRCVSLKEDPVRHFWAGNRVGLCVVDA